MKYISNHFNPQPAEYNQGIEVLGKIYSGVNTGLEVSGRTFSTPAEVVAYFGYYGAHVLSGTAMVDGGFNSEEWVGSSDLTAIIGGYMNRINRFFDLYDAGLISDDAQLTNDVIDLVRQQYPYKTHVTDKHYPVGTSFPPFLLPVLMKFTIDSPNGMLDFFQQYIVGYEYQDKDPYFGLIGDRQDLYTTYQEAFSERFPAQKSYLPYQLRDGFEQPVEE